MEKTTFANHPKILTTIGGKKRADSVWEGLKILQPLLTENDWVLVHDAARPCVEVSDIVNLIKQLKFHPIGGILGIKVKDTLKEINTQNEIEKTIKRDNVWQALTPQLFRFELLYKALNSFKEQQHSITDESSAIELLGYKPLMILGNANNIKITTPEDLSFAEYYLTLRRI